MSKFMKLSASWCAPCKQMDTQLKRLNLPVDIEHIDIDARKDVVIKYNVRSIPTLIKLDDNGDELKRSTGAQTDAKLLDFFA